MRPSRPIVQVALALGCSLVLASTGMGGTDPVQAADSPCTYELGFAALHDRLPELVGECLTEEQHDLEASVTLQPTTRGLLVWQRSDNVTLFTDGTATWSDGPDGLVRRPIEGSPFPWNMAVLRGRLGAPATAAAPLPSDRGDRLLEASKPLPRPAGATPKEARFILPAAEAARASQRVTGVPASVTIAQAILESDWGTSKLSRDFKNYFGIKAKGKPGPAGVAWFDAWEVIDGVDVVQPEPFRAYQSLEESFVDHGRFFLQNRRYATALGFRHDPQQFAREINLAGYATDPNYATKLIALMDRFNLYAYDLS